MTTMVVIIKSDKGIHQLEFTYMTGGKEIPEIVSFSKKYPEVKVFAFNFDRLDAEELRPQIKKFGITYPSMITHPRTLWGIETPKTLPATYFISPDGEIVFASLKPLLRIRIKRLSVFKSNNQ